MSTPSFLIGQRHIGPGYPCYMIAELSANHGNDFDLTKRTLQAMKQAGADAVKVQTYTADTITLDCNREPFIVRGGTLWDGRTLYDLYKEASMPWEWQPELKILAEELGMDFFSSPFDFTAVEFLAKMRVPAYKIASFELVDLPLIRKVAQTGMPVIMSTGMASLAEIDDAVRVFRESGGTQLALLKCTSAYPSQPEDINLRTIPHLSEAFGVPAGISDHTLGIAVPVAAVAIGAGIIEKHFTLSRSAPGPDNAFSLEPDEFKAMVEAVRTTERAMGRVNYEVTEKEKASRVFRRSLFVVHDMKAGDMFTEQNLRSIRPAYGLSPKHLPEVLGGHATIDLKAGTPLGWDVITRSTLA